MHTRRLRGRLTALALLAVGGLLFAGVLPAALAADRGPIEICNNNNDDDGDGAVDETSQGGCIIGPGSPTSGDGVVPEEWTDNPDCSDIGFGFGFKIDKYPEATTYPLQSGTNLVLTGGAPEDPTNSVTISSLVGDEGATFDWTSTLGIDAVIVKGGNNSNVYVYDPEATGDTGLGTPDSAAAISHIEFCYDYELDATKTATGTYDRHVDWDITKEVSPATHDLFAGGSGTSDYTVTATKTVTEDNYQVNGSITVSNPTPFDVDFTVEDTINGTTADVSCPSTTVTAGGTVVCTYGATEADGIDGDETLNTATVTSSNPNVDGDVATAGITFTPNPTGEPEPINVTDNHDNDAFDKSFGPVSETTEWTYNATFDCSTDPGAYNNGTYSFIEGNTATIDETGDNDSESVTVNCYLPTAAKDAETAYTREYTWSIGKSVDKDSHTGYPGDSFSSEYTVEVAQTIVESAFAVSGTITVTNAHPTLAANVSIVDSVGGTDATLDCGGSLDVPAGGSADCGYSASLDTKTDGTNTATVTFNSIDQDATADYTFGDPTNVVGFANVNVTDTQPDSTAPWLADGDASWNYTGDFMCPTDTGLYENGVYTYSVPNRAEITETGQFSDQNVDVTCYLPAEAKVVKTTTEGDEDIGQFPFTFELYDPNGAKVETQTLGTGGGEAIFVTDLKLEGTWQVVEVLPDGWKSTTETTCTFEVAFPGSAGQTYTCTFDNVEKSWVNLLKLTNGEPTLSQTWTFEIYAGPDGFGGTAVVSDSTPPADLDFGFDASSALDPHATYTLCELEVAAGYSTFWQVDTDGNGVGDVTVVPYNPNADDDPSEDVGNRCVDIGANTNIPLVSGTTLHFVVDNQAPGGAPRTPGYWKNWNRCTGGGQQFTADANGGYEEGFWLLEDVLDPAIGGGIVWDDILIDRFVFPIESCEVAVDILDKREVDDPSVVGDGKKKAADPLINLATHLLAAQLNFGAGACTTDDVNKAALDAEALLDKYDFDGSAGLMPKKSDDVALANELAEYLDAYNNGEFCGDSAE